MMNAIREGVNAMRNKIFISHATPDDNEFAAWLATKLELHGYDVWVDIHELNPAADFWKTIESTIRNEAVKFLFVATKISTSGTRDGVIKELAVADQIRKNVDPEFIVPLRADDVSYGDFSVEIIRLNAIDFYDNWATGLIKLLEYLEKSNTPKRDSIPTDMEEALMRWKEIKTSSLSMPIKKQDYYYSNLFPVILPNNLYVYADTSFEGAIQSKHFPYRKINDNILTFVCPNCIERLIGYPPTVEAFCLSDAMSTESSIFVYGAEIKRPDRICINLLNWSISELFFKKGLRKYRSNDNSNSRSKYFFQTGTKSRRYEKSRFKSLSGSYNDKRWHFGLSAYYTKYPFCGFVLRSHLIFTDSYENFLSDMQQISARRNKGKRFFNKEWRDLIQAAVYYLSDGSDSIVEELCCPSNTMTINRKPYMFYADMGYLEPSTDPAETVEEYFDDDE